jgi:hypothetical protein
MKVYPLCQALPHQVMETALLAREREVEKLKHSYEQARHTNQQLCSQVKIVLAQ